MTVHEHIPAAVAADVNGMFIPKKSADEANRIFTEFLSNVAKGCAGSGASMIGHIKANVRSGDEMLSISSTTGDGNVRARSSFSSSVGEYGMTVNVIVYGMEETAINKIISGCGETLGASIRIIPRPGCRDPECSDPNCADHANIIRLE